MISVLVPEYVIEFTARRPVARDSGMLVGRERFDNSPSEGPRFFCQKESADTRGWDKKDFVQLECFSLLTFYLP